MLVAAVQANKDCSLNGVLVVQNMRSHPTNLSYADCPLASLLSQGGTEGLNAGFDRWIDQVRLVKMAGWNAFLHWLISSR